MSRVRRSRSPRAVATLLERRPTLPAGEGDRFRGYGVSGVTFASGHVLALRRFPASSLGPAFTSVWHRDSRGAWTFYSDVEPSLSCSRYFADATVRVVEDEITLDWSGEYSLMVSVRGARLAWALHLTPTLATRALTALIGRIPRPLRQRPVLRAGLALAAGRILDSGRFALDGATPSGHDFAVDLHRIWTVDASSARLDGAHLGPVVLPRRQERLGGLWISCWGVFHTGEARFTSGLAG